VLSIADIRAAADRIAGRVRRTPVVAVAAAAFGVEVALKLEFLQHSGSFKARGAFNRLLAGPIPPAGVVAASGGNHGLAVAYAARELGIPAEIFVPETSAPVKVRRLRGLGVRVTQTGAWYADAYAASQQRVRQTGALMVHPYDHPHVQAGQGTVALELAEQVTWVGRRPGVDTVLLAVGGGGLLAGVATWFAGAEAGRGAGGAGRGAGGAGPRRGTGASGSVRIVAVEPYNAPTLSAALAAGRPVDVEVSGVAADSLGAGRISPAALAVARSTGVVSVLVDDKAILAARQALWDELRIAAEPGGATALAALTSGGYQPAPGERIAIICCGANTDPSDLNAGTAASPDQPTPPSPPESRPEPNSTTA
jgi:threonine dehydratase